MVLPVRIYFRCFSSGYALLRCSQGPEHGTEARVLSEQTRQQASLSAEAIRRDLLWRVRGRATFLWNAPGPGIGSRIRRLQKGNVRRE